MNLATLIDGPSALIVFGGTTLATVLRCGLADCRVTLTKLAQLGQNHFDAAATRAELAVHGTSLGTGRSLAPPSTIEGSGAV